MTLHTIALSISSNAPYAILEVYLQAQPNEKFNSNYGNSYPDVRRFRLITKLLQVRFAFGQNSVTNITPDKI
jgi:hypothetical protein